MPERLPRVGDRPAGAERGEDRAMLVLSLAAGDLGFNRLRGRGAAALGALATGKSLVLADLVRKKVEGLMKEPFEGKKLSAPLARLVNSTGSTFSESSDSVTSEAFLFTGDGLEIAALRLAHYPRQDANASMLCAMIELKESIVGWGEDYAQFQDSVIDARERWGVQV